MSKGMSKSKKGIFFTFAAITLSIILLMSFRVYNQHQKDSLDSEEIRISTMNSLIKDIENDVDNAIFAAAFRSILSIEDYMMEEDEFLNEDDAPSLDSAFDEVFRLGTIDSEEMSLMNNNTFLNWTKRMKDLANKTDISLDFAINDVAISQSGPWMVEITVGLDINVKDSKDTSSWAISREFTKQINITGFVDPLYLVKNNGLVNNTIRKTTVSDFSTQLPTHLINSYYIENSNAPSYLMRFENVLSSSSNGIESLVNLQELTDAGLSTSSKSAVDYIYYDSASATTDCRVEGMEAYAWFYLDYLPDPPNHLSFYSRICDIP